MFNSIFKIDNSHFSKKYVAYQLLHNLSGKSNSIKKVKEVD